MSSFQTMSVPTVPPTISYANVALIKPVPVKPKPTKKVRFAHGQDAFEPQVELIPRPESDEDSYDGPIDDVPPGSGSPMPRVNLVGFCDEPATIIPRPESDEDSYDGPMANPPPCTGTPMPQPKPESEPECDEYSYGPVPDIPPRSGTPCPTATTFKVLPRTVVQDIPARPKSPFPVVGFVRARDVADAVCSPAEVSGPSMGEVCTMEEEEEEGGETWSQRTIYSGSGVPLCRSPTLSTEVIAKYARRRKRRIRGVVQSVVRALKWF